MDSASAEYAEAGDGRTKRDDLRCELSLGADGIHDSEVAQLYN